MRLPELTALQFAALSLLFSGEKTARELHEQLDKWDGPRTSAAFSQLVERLRRATLIQGIREGQPGQRFSECRYRVTDLGLIVWEATRQFYAGFAPAPGDLQPVETDEVEFADYPPAQRRALMKRKFTTVMLKAFRRQRKTLGRHAD